MNILDELISVISPKWALSRQHHRERLRAYEAATINRIKNYPRDDRSPNLIVDTAKRDYRALARTLEENYDLVSGALDILEAKIIGADGINIEPQPRLNNGDIDESVAEQILKYYKEWSLRPEVTREMDWAQSQRKILRSKARDGEVIILLHVGPKRGLTHSTEVLFSIELLESNYIYNLNDPSKNMIQGIELDKWNRPRFYNIYKSYPDGDIAYYGGSSETRRIRADTVLHPKNVNRIGQVRGISALHSAITRLSDVKDYEDNERVANRLAAAIGMQITQDYNEYNAGADRTSALEEIYPGMIHYNNPGEKVEIIESHRDSKASDTYRKSMLKSAARGVRVGPSSMTGEYDGSYSARRQELVDYDSIYAVQSANIIDNPIRPIYHTFVDVLVTQGLIRLSQNSDRSTIKNAYYGRPAMPWIDPEKEVKANENAVQAGFTSRTEVIRRRGGDPKVINKQLKLEYETDYGDGVTYTTTPEASDQEQSRSENIRAVK